MACALPSSQCAGLVPEATNATSSTRRPLDYRDLRTRLAMRRTSNQRPSSSTYRCTCIPVTGYPCCRACSSAPSSLASPSARPFGARSEQSENRDPGRHCFQPANRPREMEHFCLLRTQARETATHVHRYPGFQASMRALSHNAAFLFPSPARAAHTLRKAQGATSSHRDRDIDPQNATASLPVHPSPCIHVYSLPCLAPGNGPLWPHFWTGKTVRTSTHRPIPGPVHLYPWPLAPLLTCLLAYNRGHCLQVSRYHCPYSWTYAPRDTVTSFA